MPPVGNGMSSPIFRVIKLEDFGKMTKFVLNAARGGFEHWVDVRGNGATARVETHSKNKEGHVPTACKHE